MQHTIEIPSSVTRKLIINFASEDVNKHLDATIKQLARSIDLPGFRKGKVPANIIEKKYADEVRSRTSDEMINTTIQKILADEDIHPVSRIETVEIEGNEANEIKRDAPFNFACSFEVLPEITLPAFEDLEVKLPEPTVDPKEFEAFTRRIKQTGASLEPVEEVREPQEGEICLIDVDGTFEGKPVPGMKGDNIQIQINPEQATESDVQHIVSTMKVGESKNGKIKVTDEYPDPSFRGLEIDMNVKLHSISKEILPELDDEFAKRFGFEDAAGINKFINESVMSQHLQKVKAEAQTKLIDDILEKMDYDLPPSFVAQHKYEQLMEARNFLAAQGQTTDETKETINRMEAEAEVEAKKQAKVQTFLLALAFREKITISEQEVQQYIFKAAQESGQDPKVIMERLYQNGSINDVSERLLASKAAEVLYNKANKVVVDEKGNKIEPKLVEDFEKSIKEVADEAEKKVKKTKKSTKAKEETSEEATENSED